MPKQCRSIRRALKRGHPLYQGSSTYMSKKESRILKEIYQAALRKQQEAAESQNNNDDEQKKEDI